jgi:superfamily I DNA/RNA helicase
MPTVAIGDDFLDAFARLPRPQQRKVREFTAKFKANPKSAAINYEKINGVRDDKVRTVRIDEKYRAVILHPEKGEVYVLVWVDNHDEAMAWAMKRLFEVNPSTGSLQVINVTEAAQAAPAAEDAPPGGLFAAFEDDVLLSLGVPAVLLPSVREVQSREGLADLVRHLPAEAAEALNWLANGDPVDEVREVVGTAGKGCVDTTDIARALEHPDSRRRFVTIQSDSDLEAMLDAPLARWRVFLHPSQAKLVKKHFNGPARVLGGAGTGKTVVAMHRACHLASKVFTAPEDRILFTTYTANLAQNVEEMLGTLCPEQSSRIEVIHLHAWAVRFLRSRGETVEVAPQDVVDACWDEAVEGADALDLDVGFYRLEWDQVVQANGILTEGEYLKVPRTGRGRTLSRPQRSRVWKVFERFRQSLERRKVCEWLEVIRRARRVIPEKHVVLPYRAVVVDESQDLHVEEWRLIRALVPPDPNDLFLVGDAHQRIYGRKVVLKDCGVQVQGRSSTLRINYRTTDQVRSWATALLRDGKTDDLDGGRDDLRGYVSLLSGPAPACRNFASLAEEQAFLLDTVRSLLEHRKPEEICIAVRAGKALKEDYQAMLKAHAIETTVLEKNRESEGRGVRLATMHRVKGLEFPVVILAGVNARAVPVRVPSLEGDLTALQEHEERERSLLFVAATRARDQLVVTSHGSPSRFLEPAASAAAK